MKTLGSAVALFAGDHNGQLPPTTEAPYYPGPVFGNAAPSWGPTWAEYLVARYPSGKKICLKCPARPKEWSPTGYVGNYPYYGMNERLTFRDAITGIRYGFRLSSIARPGKMVLMGDTARYSGGKAVGGFYRIYGAGDLHPRHGESHVNVLFLDMHIEERQLDINSLPSVNEPLGGNAFQP